MARGWDRPKCLVKGFTLVSNEIDKLWEAQKSVSPNKVATMHDAAKQPGGIELAVLTMIGSQDQSRNRREAGEAPAIHRRDNAV